MLVSGYWKAECGGVVLKMDATILMRTEVRR